MAIHFATMRPKYFKAMSILTPYFKLLNEEMFQNYDNIVKVLDKVCPTYRMVPFPTKGRQPQHILHFVTDPLTHSKGLMPIRNVTVSNLLRNKLEQEKLHL